VHGGVEGSGKSHFFAEMLVERCLTEKTFAVCVREVQKSLKQSVKRLIENKIQSLGVGSYFDIQVDMIKTPYGGQIIFQGMQDHTAESIKSLEGFDVAWVEEAQSISLRSLGLLRPTIRKAGSELWFSWNPGLATDAVDDLLRGPNAIKSDGGVIVVEANWLHNPWFPQELRDEMASDLERSPETYDHVWNGAYQTVSDAIIFNKRTVFKSFETPATVGRFFYGVDWGFANDPLVVIRSFIQDDILYIDQEEFGYSVEIDETGALFERVPGIRQWPIKADGARPELISYMKRSGFDISAATKWAGSVEDGIAHLRGFKSIVIHDRCPNMAREARLYSYKTDKLSGDILPVIVDKHNHGWDAVRYSLDGYIKGKRPMAISDSILRRSAQPARR
jgi:phage terminase large subunit